MDSKTNKTMAFSQAEQMHQCLPKNQFQLQCPSIHSLIHSSIHFGVYPLRSSSANTPVGNLRNVHVQHPLRPKLYGAVVPNGTLIPMWCTSFDQVPQGSGPKQCVVHDTGIRVPFGTQSQRHVRHCTTCSALSVGCRQPTLDMVNDNGRQ